VPPATLKTLFAGRRLLLRTGGRRARRSQHFASGRDISRWRSDARFWGRFHAGHRHGQIDSFFEQASRARTGWWPGFFSCLGSGNVSASKPCSREPPRRELAPGRTNGCMIDRLQREGSGDRRLRASGERPADRPAASRGYVFKRDFALPLSNFGLTWLMACQDGSMSARSDRGNQRQARTQPTCEKSALPDRRIYRI